MTSVMDHFLRFVDKTDSREKLLRLTQFLIVLVLAWWPGSPLLSQLKVQVLIMRKVLRCFKPLSHGRVALNQITGEHKAANYGLITLKHICFMLYLGLDQLVLLRMLNVIPSNDMTTVLLPKFTNLFWLSALSVDIRINLSIVQMCDKDPTRKEQKAQITARYRTRRRAIRKIIWDVLDSYVVSTYLHYATVYSSIVGLCGITTSVMAMQDLWGGCE